MPGKEKVVYGSIKNKVTASDLIKERANCDFDPNYGKGMMAIADEHYRQRFVEAVEFTQNDPVMKNSHKFYEMTREE